MIRISAPPKPARPYFSQKQFAPVFRATTEALRQEVSVKNACKAAKIETTGEQLVAWYAEQGLVG